MVFVSLLLLMLLLMLISVARDDDDNTKKTKPYSSFFIPSDFLCGGGNFSLSFLFLPPNNEHNRIIFTRRVTDTDYFNTR